MASNFQNECRQDFGSIRWVFCDNRMAEHLDQSMVLLSSLFDAIAWRKGVRIQPRFSTLKISVGDIHAFWVSFSAAKQNANHTAGLSADQITRKNYLFVALESSFSGCPPDFVAKLAGGPNLLFTVCKNGTGWEWNAKIQNFSVKTVISKGQEHSIGAHAPNYKVNFLFKGLLRQKDSCASDWLITLQVHALHSFLLPDKWLIACDLVLAGCTHWHLRLNNQWRHCGSVWREVWPDSIPSQRRRNDLCKLRAASMAVLPVWLWNRSCCLPG